MTPARNRIMSFSSVDESGFFSQKRAPVLLAALEKDRGFSRMLSQSAHGIEWVLAAFA
jgi:hypothetical protein